MKYEFGTDIPSNLKEYWPGQYDLFSNFEYLTGIPHALFLITTLKENGKANACYHSWSAFSGDPGGFFAVLTGLMQHTHTYKNILREKEFCVNFLSAEYDAQVTATIKNNDADIDEIEAAGLTAEPAKEIAAPRIKEAFLTFECKLESCADLSGKGITAMIIGRMIHASLSEAHKDIKAAERDFTFYIHAPKDPATGEGDAEAHARLNVYWTIPPKNENQLVGINIVSSNPQKLADFYQTVLDAEIVNDAAHGGQNRIEIWFGAKSDNTTFIAVHRDEKFVSQEYDICHGFELRMTDVDAEYNRILSLGVEIKEPPRDLPWGYRYFNIKDPDGNGIDLVQKL